VLLHDHAIVQRCCVSVNAVQLISSGSCGWWQVGHCGDVNVLSLIVITSVCQIVLVLIVVVVVSQSGSVATAAHMSNSLNICVLCGRSLAV
jgi:hypothetical protein